MIRDYMWGKMVGGNLRVCAVPTALSQSEVNALVGRSSSLDLSSLAEATVVVSEFGIKRIRSSDSALTSYGALHTVPQELVLDVKKSGVIVGVVFLLLVSGTISKAIYVDASEIQANRWRVGVDDRDGVTIVTS